MRNKNFKAVILTSALCLLSWAASAYAAPTLSVGNMSGTAGSSVTLSINFNPAPAAVAGIQFNLTLPTGVSTGVVTAGSIVNTAAKSVTANLNGNTWTFIIFGLNQTTIASGILLTAQMDIAGGVANGSLSLPISNITFTDAAGLSITPGTSTGGTITVSGGTPPPPPPPPPANVAPTVTLGANQTITLPATANLTGTATDDGLPSSPGALVLSWSKVSGPGNVTFGNPAALTTSATFSAAGTYVLRLTANDSLLSGNDTVQVTVNAAPAVTSPILTVGSVAGLAGSQINVPITFNPGNASVAGIQFNLTVPSSLSTGTVTAGSIVTTAGKSVSANLNGNTWTFIIFGLNQTTIASGALLTAQMNIAGGAASGNLSLAISNITFTDASGVAITGGTSTGGTVTVTAITPPPPPPPPPGDTTVPTTPTGVTLSVISSTEIDLAWTASTDNVGVVGYGITRGNVFVSSVTGTTFANTGLTPSTAYSYRIRAYDAAGNVSARSTSVSATTLAAPTTTAPTLAVGSATVAAGATVNLPITFNTGGASIASLQFDLVLPTNISTVSVTAGAVMTTANKTSADNLLSGNTWRILVMGVGNQTAMANGTLLLARVRVASSAPAGTLNVQITNITYSNPSGTAVTGGTSTGGTLTVTGGTTPPPPPPPPPAGDTTVPTTPTGVTLSVISSTEIDLAWTASTDNVGVVGYGITRGNVFVSSVTSGTTYKNMGLTPSTAYSYRIRAYDAAGNVSARSTSVSATTLAAPTTTAPTLAVGSATGAPGATVNLPITLSIGNASIASLQFDLVLPTNISTVSVTAGAVMTTANKTSADNMLSGNRWRILVMGLGNQTAMANGTLLLARVRIASSAAAGTLNVQIANITYSDPSGTAVTGGTSTGGTLTVTGGTTPPPPPPPPAPTAPTLTGGSTSGAAGSTVSFPISFNPGGKSVAGLQFSITLPSSLSAGPVTAGSVVTVAGKTATANVSGNTWTFIVFGLNQTTLGTGSLLTAQMQIAPGTAAGTINLPLSGVVYTDASGVPVASGSNTGVTLTITSGGSALVTPDLSGMPNYIPVNGSVTAGYSASLTNVGFNWTFTPTGAGAPSQGAGSLYKGSAPVTKTFPSTSNSAGLAGHDLTPGTWLVSVYAFDSSGHVSATASRGITLVPGDFAAMRVFPNPWRSDKGYSASQPYITFDRLPLGSDIKIFTVSGHLAAKVALTADPTIAKWYLTNDSGDKVASGIYLYLITDASGEKARGKVVIIK